MNSKDLYKKFINKVDSEVNSSQQPSTNFKWDNTVDHWWGSGDIVARYHFLSKMVMSLHGPQIESSFNVMQT